MTVLAGCQEGDSSSATSPVGPPSIGGAPAGPNGSSAAAAATATSTGTAATSAPGCPEPIATNTYVRATAARANGNTVVVTANPAQRVCGGPDNGHYEIGVVTEQLTLTAATTVVVLTTTPSGVGHETVALTGLPQRLVEDRFGRIFLVRGPASAVTSLEEQYHP